MVRQHVRHAQRPRRLQLAREQRVHAAEHRLVDGVRGARVRLPGRRAPAARVVQRVAERQGPASAAREPHACRRRTRLTGRLDSAQ